MTGISPTGEQSMLRAVLTRHICGNGLELGPGHAPFNLAIPGSHVSYVDRWEPNENRGLFPELGNSAPFPEPDVVADLDVDKLSMVDDASQDFVIASHVLEHLANPLAQVSEFYRVLRDGGVAIILLPDRRFTFDRNRAATPLDHLISEFEHGICTIDDAHVEDFCRGTGEPIDDWSPEQRRKQFDWHLQRSIHVHCWTEDEFLPVMAHTIRSMGMHWDLVDAIFPCEVQDGMEFGFVVRKSEDLDPKVAVERLTASWTLLHDRATSRAAASLVADLQARAELAEAFVSRIRSLPGYPLARRVASGYRRVRRR